MYQMNSKILAPKTQMGAIAIKNFKGGEINWEKVAIEATVENCPTEQLNRIPTYLLRKEMENCKKELENLPKRYSIINGIVKENKGVDKILLLRERIRVGYIILNRRKSKIHERIFRTRRLKSSKNESLEYEIMRFNPSMIRQPAYEMSKGDKMKLKNEVKDESFTDEFGEFHERITKECVSPYTREGGIKKKDFLTLHWSGRLGMMNSLGEIAQTLQYAPTNEDEALLELFKTHYQNGARFFVILPKGGRKSKKYGETPMKPTPYHIKNNFFIPIEDIVRKIYIPEIDGVNPKARDLIHEYRGPIDGFAPVYTYDEQEHIRDFVPELLSYNYVEYSKKFIILLGTQKRINLIDRRIKGANKMRFGFHNFTNQKLVGYKGQTSRCENLRIVPEGDTVHVFGLNLNGTPEENLKGYLRSFDRVPYRDMEEVRELIEIAENQDGRQTVFNIEHDLRFELKSLQTKTSSELYYLIKGVEDETNGSFKEQKKILALLNVLKSFKSSKEIQEEEQKGLTADLKDLVEIEKNSNDSSYKKGKNLFNQKEGVLRRNQNPLYMEGEVEPLSNWTIKGRPISFPRNDKLPKRNISFIKRGSTYTIKGPLGMFSRDFDCRVYSEERIVPIEKKPVGVIYSSSSSPNYNLFLSTPMVGIVTKPIKKEVDRETSFEGLDKTFEKCVKESKAWNNQRLQDKMDNHDDTKLRMPEPRFKGRVTDFPVELPKKWWKVIKQEVTYPGFSETMFPRKVLVPKLAKQRIIRPCLKGAMFPRTLFFRRYLKQYEEVSNKERFLLQNKRPSQFERYLSKGSISTVRLFDDRTRPGEVLKKVSWRQFKASEQKPYQFSGKLVFDEKNHEFVRITPPNKPSPFKILHTIGNGKGGVDYCIIDINGQKLYAKGDLSLLKKESISFTGTRNPKKETRNFVKQTIKMFLEDDDYVTISGGAEGCDTLVHYQTIGQGGKTVVVLAGGFNQYFKKSQIKPEEVLKNGGLILSEHPPEYGPSKKDFILRNKIIASLSDRLVVFEAGRGTIHCAKFGAQLGKELLVQPGTENSTKIISEFKGRPFFPLEGYYPF